MRPWSTLCHPPQQHTSQLPSPGTWKRTGDVQLFLAGLAPEIGEQGQAPSPQPEVAMEGMSGSHTGLLGGHSPF